jgi:hypothetical protein
VLEGTSGNKVGVAKCHDDLVTVSRGESDFNSDRVQYSRGEESLSTTGRERLDSTSTGTEIPENSTDPRLHGGSAPFPGLTEKDLDSVCAEFPALDFPAVYSKFVDYHTKKGTEQATKAMLAGWFKREKPQKTADQSRKVKTADSAENASTGSQERGNKSSVGRVKARLTADNLDELDLDDFDYLGMVDWRIGNLKPDWKKICSLYNMTSRSREEAKAYFVEMMGDSVDADQFFDDGGEWYLIFVSDAEEGMLQGAAVAYARQQHERKLKALDSEIHNLDARIQYDWERAERDRDREFKLKALQEKGVDDQLWFTELDNSKTDLAKHVDKNWPKTSDLSVLAKWVLDTFELPATKIDPQAFSYGSIKPKHSDQAWSIMYHLVDTSDLRR